MSLLRNWLTRPATPSEAASLLAKQGAARCHQTWIEKRDAMTARLREDIAAGRIAPMHERGTQA